MARPEAETDRARAGLAVLVLAWSLAVIALALFVTDGVVYFSALTSPALFQAGGGAISAFWLFPYVSVIPVGLLLALRRPHNPIGWLLLGGASLLGVGATSALVGSILAEAHNGLSGPVLLLSAVWNAPGGGVISVLLAMLLLFPDGHLPSRQWRWVMYALVVIAVGGPALAVINPTPGQLGETTSAAPGLILSVSVLAIPGTARVVNTLSTVLSATSLVLGTAVIGSVFLRLRGANADRRHQVKWVAFGAMGSLATVAVLNALPVGNTGVPPPWYFATAGPVLVVAGIALPGTIGIAVLKYRLYDIDLIISRTLVYGALAALITGVYIAIAVGVGALVGSGGQPNLWLSIVATVVVAVGFQPVRERLQRVANRLVYGTRATPYEVLSEFSAQVAETYAADEVLPRMARILQEGTGAEAATVWLRSGAHLRQAATVSDHQAETFAPVAVGDDGLPPLPGATMSVRVEHQGSVLGALSIVKRKGDSLTPVEEKLMSDLAHQAGLVLRNVGLTAELRQRLEDLRTSRQRLVRAQDEERRRLERNLHDGAQQHLVAIKVKLGLAQMLATKAPDRARTTLEQLKSDADEALETLRNLARGIYPPLLADKGLVVALESQARKATIPVTVEAGGVERYAQNVETTVYFCVLEALQNVQKYAGATHAVVRLRDRAEGLTFDVTDDGKGFEPAAAGRGSGLTNMADRLDALEGSVEILSRPGAGTTVRGTIPVKARAAVAI